MVDSAEIIRRVYEGFQRGDIEPLLAALDPLVEWNEAEHVTFWPGSAFVGPDAVVKGLFARIPKTFGPTWSVTVERLIVCGDTVIMQGRYHGTSQATGRELFPQVAHVWDLADGRIVKFSSTPTPGCSPTRPGSRRSLPDPHARATGEESRGDGTAFTMRPNRPEARRTS